MPVKLPPPWPEFLKELDQRLSAPVELHCLGGFVLAALYGLTRPTDDLDYISAVPRDALSELEQLGGLGSQLCKKHKVFLQSVGAIPDLPDGYEERLTKLELGLTKLSLKVLDPYDLVLSKLARNSPKDREDVKNIATRRKLSFKILVERFDAEMRPWIPHAGRHALTLDLWQEYFSE
ncbi:MAG TPA: DUF6036 family nucleotidyltransferase [Terriglobales bacterium]